jgi:tRNA(adenine34) deaminase
MVMRFDHEKHMHAAMAQARQGALAGEVPVGAVLVDAHGNTLAQGYNQPISRHDATAHAEVICLRRAGRIRANYRLLNTTLYVSIEPCVMCMGALIHARVRRVVYGATDPKWGGAGSLFNLAQDARLNHRIEVIGGVCEEACRDLIQRFFKTKRMLN